MTTAGELRPLHPARARGLSERQGEHVAVRILDQGDLRRDRQNRYWWGAIVDTVRDLWEREIQALIPKEAVHDKLVTIFGGGLVDTPEGPARTSSRTKTVREFAVMVDEVRTYVWHRYGVPIPTGEEWERREHSQEGYP